MNIATYALLISLCFSITVVTAAESEDDYVPVSRISLPGSYTERIARSPEYQRYVVRLRSRRERALAIRRYNSLQRGPHVYQISGASWIANPFWSAIDLGRVSQPPIPRRPGRVVEHDIFALLEESSRSLSP